MDFSSKQALGVVVVIGVAALVIGAAVFLTKTNNTNAKKTNDGMWTKTNSMIDANMDGAGTAGGVNGGIE